MLLYPSKITLGIWVISSSAVHQPWGLSIDFLISGSDSIIEVDKLSPLLLAGKVFAVIFSR